MTHRRSLSTPRRCILLLAVTLASASFVPLRAQEVTAGRYTLVVRGTPLSEALERLAVLAGIDLVYPSSLVAGRVSFCDGRRLPAEALLACVLDGLPLDYVRSSSGTYVLIEAVQRAPETGMLAGRVVDSETGEPLPAATVLLADAGAATTTSEAGLFAVAGLLSGPHRLVVTYIGYETNVDRVWVVPGRGQRFEVRLRPRAIDIEPVVIDGLTQRLPSSRLAEPAQDAATLHAAAAGGAPGGTPDVARGAARFPGVATYQPLAELHIQGGGGGEHLILLDGVAVRDPVALGRHLSAFSPLALARITAHRAGHGVEVGSQLSGVLAIEQDVRGDAPSGGAVSVDPVSLNAKVQGDLRLPGAVRGAGMVALRTSAWPLYRDPGVEALLDAWSARDPLLTADWVGEPVPASPAPLRSFRPDVSFSDLHAAARLDLTPFQGLHVSAFRATNRIGSRLATATPRLDGTSRLIVTHDDYAWKNWAGRVRHDLLLGARTLVTSEALANRHRSGYAYDGTFGAAPPLTTVPDLEAAARTLEGSAYGALASAEAHTISELTFRSTVSHSLTAGSDVEVALLATRTASRFRLGNPFVAPMRYANTGWDVAGYVRGRWTVATGATLEPGLRWTYVPVRRTVYGEPRLALRYDRASSAVGGYALRVAGGVYRQFTGQYELTNVGSTVGVPAILFWLPTDASLAPPRAYHAAVEALLLPGPAWSVRGEVYHKWQPRLLVLDYVALLARSAGRAAGEMFVTETAQAAFIGTSRGRAYGASVQVEHAGAWGRAGLRYDYGRAARTFPGRFGGRRVPVPWSEPHRLALDGVLPVLSRLDLTLHAEGGWGRSWAFRRAYYDYVALAGDADRFAPFDVDRPGAHARGPRRRVDAGVRYARTWGGLGIHVQAAVIDVLDERPTYDWNLEQGGGGAAVSPRTLPGRQVVVALRVEL